MEKIGKSNNYSTRKRLTIIIIYLFIYLFIRLQTAYKIKKAPNFKSEEHVNKEETVAVEPTCSEDISIGLLNKLIDGKTLKRKSIRRVFQADLIELSKLFGLATNLKCEVLRENLNKIMTEDIMEKINISNYSNKDHNNTVESIVEKEIIL